MRTCRSCGLAVACVHACRLCLSRALDDRDLPGKCVRRQSVRGRLAHAWCAGSFSDAGHLHSVVTDSGLGNSKAGAVISWTGRFVLQEEGLGSVVSHISQKTSEMPGFPVRCATHGCVCGFL